MSDPAPRVLVLGLDPHRVPGPWDPEPVAAAIEAGRRRFVEHGVAADRELAARVLDLVATHAAGAAVAHSSTPETPYDAAAPSLP